MISAHMRKIFTYLRPGYTSFVREFHASLALPLHYHDISAKSVCRPIAVPTVSEILLGRIPGRYESIPFLKENGFSDSQLQKMIQSKPGLRTAKLEKSIKPKFKIFQEMGFSPTQIVVIITREPTILLCSTNNRFIPSLTALKGLLGSNEKMVKVLLRCGWFLIEDLDKNMKPNIEYLKSCGVPMEHIICLLPECATCLFLRPEVLRNCVEKLDRFGVDKSSKMYIPSLRVVCKQSNESWELKWQAFRDLGFSETDILMIIKKAPTAFGLSIQKIKRMVEVLLATKRYTISSVAAFPISLCCNIDGRIKPRLQLLESLDKSNLIRKWPSLSVVATLTEERFYEKFVAPYPDVAGQIIHWKEYLKQEERSETFGSCIKEDFGMCSLS